MKIYIDSEFRCHADNPDGMMREAETNFFDGKCKAFIEGYRFVPYGESWTREDGTVFEGQMITPRTNYEELCMRQRYYERAQLADMKEALNMLGVTVDE